MEIYSAFPCWNPTLGRGDLGPTPVASFLFFFMMRAWSDALWSQLRPREVSHRSVKCGGVGGLRASIDACQKLFGKQPEDCLSNDRSIFARIDPLRFQFHRLTKRPDRWLNTLATQTRIESDLIPRDPAGRLCESTLTWTR